MKKMLLVGDSGGTSTDWCLVDRNGERKYFSTDSYQPIHFSDPFFESMTGFWRKMNLDPETEIHFYGAGCSMKHNQEQIENHFKSLGFLSVFAASDLLGVCRALLGNEAGLAGILGTGSVVAEYDGTEIVKLHGGYGYLIGDEGSGYTFGKLLISKYLNLELSTGLTTELAGKLGDRTTVMREIYTPEGKKWIASLAAGIARCPEIELIHRENIIEFIGKYLRGKDFGLNTICFSGSYAFYNSEIIRSILDENGWVLQACIEKPIEKITDYTIKTTL